VYLILAGGALGFLSWFIPSMLVKVVNSDVIDPRSVPETARQVIAHRDSMPLLGLPVIIFGLMVINKVPWRWLWVLLGLLSMLLPMVLLIYTFIATIGLLYQPRDAFT
jgi:hypothetical protein